MRSRTYSCCAILPLSLYFVTVRIARAYIHQEKRNRFLGDINSCAKKVGWCSKKKKNVKSELIVLTAKKCNDRFFILNITFFLLLRFWRNQSRVYGNAAKTRRRISTRRYIIPRNNCAVRAAIEKYLVKDAHKRVYAGIRLSEAARARAKGAILERERVRCLVSSQSESLLFPARDACGRSPRHNWFPSCV